MYSPSSQSAVSWLKQRALGRIDTPPRLSIDTIRRLNFEKTIDVDSYLGLRWNHSGSLLAGYNQNSVRISNPFANTSIRIVDKIVNQRGKRIEFIPAYDERLISLNTLNQVKVIDIATRSTVLHCHSCFNTRCCSQVTHPHEPFVIWLQDNQNIRQYDIREGHDCRLENNKNVILEQSNFLTGMAINPVRSEILALSTKKSVRLFDKRMFHTNDESQYTTKFALGYVPNSVLTRSYTELSFNTDGSEMLVSDYGFHLTLFKTYEPWEPYKSFAATMGPLLDKLPTEISQHTNSNSTLKPYRLWKDLRQSCERRIKLPSEHQEFYDQTMQKIKRKEDLRRSDYEKMNSLIEEYKYCAELYHLRSDAFWNRAWEGDRYQSLRDLCCAIALDPSIKEVPIHDTGDDLEEKKSYITSRNFEEDLEARREIETYIEAQGIRLDEASRWNFESLPDCTTFDYTKRFYVDRIEGTDYLQGEFFRFNDDYIVAPFHQQLCILDKRTANIVEQLPLKCDPGSSVAPHPSLCLVAIESNRETLLLSPLGSEDKEAEKLLDLNPVYEARHSFNFAYDMSMREEFMACITHPKTWEAHVYCNL